MRLFELLFTPKRNHNPARELALIGAEKRRARIAERTAELQRDIAVGRVLRIAPRDVVVGRGPT